MPCFLTCGLQHLGQGPLADTACLGPLDQAAQLGNGAFPAFLIAPHKVAEIFADVAVAPDTDLRLDPFICSGIEMVSLDMEGPPFTSKHNCSYFIQ